VVSSEAFILFEFVEVELAIYYTIFNCKKNNFHITQSR
jgi:hypothetical protein